ncbi:MAG: DUF3488 and transglutaminase-like domain-containing protein [Actinomycetota bacterium]
MADPQRTLARPHRLIGALAVLAVAGATAIAFGRVFVGHGPTWKLLAVGIVSAGIAVAFERRSLILATLISAAACAIAVAVVVFPDSALFGLPTMHTFHLAVSAAGKIGQEAKIQVAPTQPLAPLMLAGVVAVWAAVFSMHSLAVRTGSPLLALLPPIALLAFADTVLEETVKPQYGIFFLIAALCLVFADGLRRVQGWGPMWDAPARGRARPSPMGSGARRMGLACVAAAVLAPILLPGFGSKAVIDLSSSTGTGLDPLVSIRAQLNRTKPIELFRVRSPQAAYWRMVSEDSFDGTTWRPEPSQDPVSVEPQLSLAAPGLDPTLPTGQRFTAQFTITSDLGSQWLPAAYAPTTVASDTPLQYDVGSLSLSADGPLRMGTSYAVTSTVEQPTPEELDRAVFTHSSEDLRYTALPDGMPADIAATAREWTQGQPNDYRSILAIQNRLTSFVYDPTVAPRADNLSMSDFLTVTKRGFCQQFASSMAVMLRTLGIPARVAVGFTEGSLEDGGDTRVVTTADYHAWVEVLFPTYGWLAFDPTPGRSNPLAAEYAQPAATCSGHTCGSGPGNADPGKGAPAERGVGQRHRKVPDAGSGQAPTTDAPRSWQPYAAAGTAVLLLGLLGLPLWRGASRRMRRRRAGRTPRARILASYRTFTERAASLGYTRASGETIQEYRARVASLVAVAAAPLTDLSELAGAAAYGPGDLDAGLGDQADEAARDTLRALRSTRTLRQRLLGAYVPART